MKETRRPMDPQKAQDTFLSSRERYRSVVETAGSAIIYMGLDNRILEWNPAAEKVFGYDREEVLGQEFVRMFISEPGQAALLQEMEKVGEGEPLQGYESSVVRKDGTFRTLLWNATRIQGEGGTPEGLCIIGQDITRRRKAEQQVEALNAELEQKVQERTAQLEEANRELEAFSYSVSHDLRAPLRAIDGFTQVIQEDYAQRLDDEGRRLLFAIRSSTRRMEMLIADLLALSRVGRKELVQSDVDMTELARSVFQEVASPQARQTVRFTLSILPVAWGDASLLRQVWENLLGNALKFSSGRATPSIEVWSETVDGKVIYNMKDNGAGFAMQYEHKLFQVFQRLHSEAEFKGTGVGLAIVQRIIRRHGGSVWAESKPGEGATFSFTLAARR